MFHIEKEVSPVTGCCKHRRVFLSLLHTHTHTFLTRKVNILSGNSQQEFWFTHWTWSHCLALFLINCKLYSISETSVKGSLSLAFMCSQFLQPPLIRWTSSTPDLGSVDPLTLPLNLSHWHYNTPKRHFLNSHTDTLNFISQHTHRPATSWCLPLLLKTHTDCMVLIDAYRDTYFQPT